MSDIRLLRLSDNSKIKPFDCGDDDLNDFLYLTMSDVDSDTRLMYFDLIQLK